MTDIAEYTRDPARLLLDLAGETVTLTKQTVTGYDDYGDPIYDEQTTNTTAEIVVRGTPAFERRIEGVDTDVTAVGWVMDDVADYVQTGDADDETGPTEVETSTHTYDVYDFFVEGNGKLRLHLTGD